jgi:hypothetical protein
VVKILYNICHIISAIILLCSEFHLRPLLMFAEICNRSSPH